jgi:hypothetical protein
MLSSALVIATAASAQDSTLVLYDYDQIGNLTSVRRTDMKSDASHCGAPTNVCPSDANGTPVCDAGTCSLNCSAGYTRAANNVCGSVSSPGVTLQFVSYAAYFLPVPTIPAGAYYCGGAFVLPQDDVNNCGACGHACTAGDHGTAFCESGACGVRCDAGYMLAANGECGSVSSPGVTLRFVPIGAYFLPVPTIPAGSYYCGGAFVSPDTDPSNCGACGNVCSAGADGGAVCAAGVCG